MAYVPYAVEKGAVYTLTGPTGVVAVFNDSANANYVGMITDIAGLDSPEVRESAEDLTEADGGSHGFFYFARRPIIITASVFGHSSVAARTLRIDRANRASLALRGDATLSWTNSGGLGMFTTLRRQQRMTQSGGWVKEIQLPMVSEYAVLFSSLLHTLTGTPVSCENKGSYVSYPIIELADVTANPRVTDDNGGDFRTTGLNMVTGEVFQADMLNHTAQFTAGVRAGQNATRYIDFLNTNWVSLAPAATTTVTRVSGGGTLTVKWRDVWV